MIGRFFRRLPEVPGKPTVARRQGPRTLALAGIVWVLLWLARLLLLLVPLRQLARFYGVDRGVNPSVPSASPVEIARARHIGRAMTLAVKYSPKSANCYPQALVARALLVARRIPHGLFFGVSRNGARQPMEAHAWVMVGPLAVCGGDSFGKFTVLRCFSTERTRDLRLDGR